MDKENPPEIYVAIFHTKIGVNSNTIPAQIMLLVPDDSNIIAILLLSNLVSNVNDWELSALMKKEEFEGLVKNKMLTDSSFLSPN